MPRSSGDQGVELESSADCCLKSNILKEFTTVTCNFLKTYNKTSDWVGLNIQIKKFIATRNKIPIVDKDHGKRLLPTHGSGRNHCSPIPPWLSGQKP